MPVVAAILLVVPREDRRTWQTAVALQAVVLLVGLAAAATGESDSLAVQFLVDAEPIDAHENAARVFLAASAAALLAFGVGLGGRTATRRRRAAAAALVLGVLAAGLGLRAGHLGGELVFQHGAVRAHQEVVEPRPPATR